MNLKMTFICDQNWNDLADVDCGKFCSQCNKTVVDFTFSSKEKIAKELESNKEVCGLYNLEQVETDVIAPIKNVFQSPFFVYLTSLVLLLNSRTTFAQTNNQVKIEKVEQSSDSTKSDSNHVVVERTTCTDHGENCNTHKANKNNHRQLYFTKRFPFIAYRRRTVMGASVKYL